MCLHGHFPVLPSHFGSSVFACKNLVSSTVPLHLVDKATEEFMTFLAGVDCKPPPESVLKAAAASFIYGLTAPDQLVGVVEKDIATSLTMASKALARRAIRAANAPVSPLPSTIPAATIETVSSQPQQTPSNSLSNDVNDLVGPDYSAAVVANLMAHAEHLEETDLMSAAGFLTLPFQLRPDPLVWRVLHTENVAAFARGRKLFSYVDLTAKGLLPLWLAPDAVGGKTPAGADWGAVLDPNAPSKKFFRTHSQWQAVFNKYCVAAIALKQISWDAKFAYEDLLIQLLAKDKASSSSIFLMVLYDDLFRRQLARRALAGEPELDVNKCFQSRDDTILQAARVRLTSVLISAGLAVDIENSLLAKSLAAADAIRKKAAAAAKVHDPGSRFQIDVFFANRVLGATNGIFRLFLLISVHRRHPESLNFKGHRRRPLNWRVSSSLGNHCCVKSTPEKHKKPASNWDGHQLIFWPNV